MLPFDPPVAPMLAKLARELPLGEQLIYEPKWDGFRGIVFRDGNSLELASRNQRSLTRYFPELMDPLRRALPERCVVDGEVVIAGPSGLDFEALLQRIHPAGSRIERLAALTPASFVAFDLLALGDRDLRGAPFLERRQLLESALDGTVAASVHLTPATRDPNRARDWFQRFEGAGLDGVVAKLEDLPYRENQRVMLKVKHQRTADCVVGAFRRHADGAGVGSLLLGLYDDQGTLQHVGVAASFNAQRRRQLLEELQPHRPPPDAQHPWLVGDGPVAAGRRPGTPSRWSAKEDLSFEALRPELVCEVAFDHLQGDRFRHATTFLRWRPDRDPSSCTYGQLEVTVPIELTQIFAEAPDRTRPPG
ncbi:MAG: ATP-dependent DNA ligase [Candidatus Dormibacteria bacterium]